MYEEIYDGIDLKYYGNGKQMEYDFIVEPGADFSQIKIQYEGAESIAVNDNGELVVTTKWGEVVEQRPVIYQVENNSRISVTGKYKIIGASSFSFELSGYNRSLPLVIDPILTYSTYVGGTAQDDALGFAVDSSGNAYIIGWTASTDFPTTAATFQDTLSGTNFDAFVTKLNPNGSALVYSTYLGGDNAEAGFGITVDNSGNAYLTGRARSTDFPTTAGAYQTSLNGTNYDAFITKLNSSGNGLIYSTFLGGTKDEDSYDIALDSFGNVYIAGVTESSNLPTTVGAYQTIFIGGGFYAQTDAYVAKLNPSGDSLIYSTYLGGNNNETAWSIDADNSGNAYITGFTKSTDFPTTAGAYQTTLIGSQSDAFVTKLNSSGTALVYGTFLGGGDDSETAYGIAADNSGNAYITGLTGSTNFPTTVGAYQDTSYGSGNTNEIFVTKLNPSGNTLVYSTYIGGNSTEFGKSIALDSSGNVYIAGHTASTDFPTTAGAFQTINNGGPYDGFMLKLNSFGNALDYSTYMGGSVASENMYGIALDGSENVYFAGETSALDFPTTVGAYQTTYQGTNGDAIVVKFSDFVTAIKEYDIGNLPKDFKMSQNYPNPFNPTTTIEFNLPERSRVTVKIYNLLGQEVQQLVNQEFSAGNYKVTWDGTSSNGVQASTGIYFYRIETENFVETKKMLLLK